MATSRVRDKHGRFQGKKGSEEGKKDDEAQADPEALREETTPEQESVKKSNHSDVQNREKG